jgi:hypothetical protein
MQRHPLAAVSVAYFCFLLLGCAALGVPAADTFNKKAAAATISVNTGSQSVLTLLQARKITPDESDAYTDRLEETQRAIDLTRTVYKTNPTDAEDRLAAIIASLNILLAELERRQ